MFWKILGIDPSTEPISRVADGMSAELPEPFPKSFSFAAVPGFEELTLDQIGQNGDETYVVRKPNGGIASIMTPKNGVNPRTSLGRKYFSIPRLVASSILNKDVTGQEYSILPEKNGIRVEKVAARPGLMQKLKDELQTQKADVTTIYRPKAADLDVTGRGYYVENCILYRNGKEVNPTKQGFVGISVQTGRQVLVDIAWIMFSTFPTIYNFDPVFHKENDHINGDPLFNVPWNFRPVTKRQNALLSVMTGERSKRPGPNSSHEKFKTLMRAIGGLSKPMTDFFIATGSMKQYKKTRYWLHRGGAVLKKTRRGFEYVRCTVDPKTGYVRCFTSGNVHATMMKVFGLHKAGLDVMHLNDNREDNRLSNLKMGTRKENAPLSKGVVVYIFEFGVPKKFGPCRSQNTAADMTRINQCSISCNLKLNADRDECDPPIRSTTRTGIEYYAEWVDVPPDQYVNEATIPAQIKPNDSSFTVNVDGRKTRSYATLDDAAAATGISRNNLNTNLIRNRETRTPHWSKFGDRGSLFRVTAGPNAIIGKKRPLVIDIDGETHGPFSNQTEASRKTRIPQCSISANLRNNLESDAPVYSKTNIDGKRVRYRVSGTSTRTETKP